MQSLKHAPHRLGPPERPERRTSIAVFSLRGDSFPAVVSLLLLLAGDIEPNPGPNCYAFRRCTTTPPQLRQGPLKTNRFVSASANRVSQSALCILQWNADRLSPKVSELRHQLQLEMIDSCLIQETKLIPKDPTTVFPGFSAIRQDRPSSHRGGGLLTLVKEGIVYQRIAEDYQQLLEKQSIQIQLSRRRWATIHNLYAARICGQAILAQATTEPENLFLAGDDHNAHSPLWDEHQPADQRGEFVEDWLLCQNARTVTFVNTGTGGLSTPDITAVSNALPTGTEWAVGEDLGSEPQPPPITTTIRCEVPAASTSRRRARWNSFYAAIEKQ